MEPVVVSGRMVLEGDEAVTVARTLIGATDGRKAAPGTIRGDFGCSKSNNLVHGSDSPESAARELAIWFPDTLIDWTTTAGRTTKLNVGEGSPRWPSTTARVRQ